jgi:hypothetical protein
MPFLQKLAKIARLLMPFERFCALFQQKSDQKHDTQDARCIEDSRQKSEAK